MVDLDNPIPHTNSPCEPRLVCNYYSKFCLRLMLNSIHHGD
jgi:hypothetical protein